MLVMTLRETLPVKENSFFAPDKEMRAASDSLSKTVIP
jgi:hypothetical protein